MKLLSVVGSVLISLFLIVSSASASDDVKIASFNIEIFGETKLNKPEVVAYLAEIVRSFDIISIQEIKDVSQTVPGEFLEEINKDGRNYLYVISERTGQQANDERSQEQYALYYDADRIVSLDDGALFDDSVNDLFQREPYTARFGVVGTPFTLTITSIHTRPTRALEEIGSLHDVYLDVEKRYPDEERHLIVGDFNAGCDYASPNELDTLEIRSVSFHWIVPDSADTNVNPNSECAYDRLVANPALFDHFKLWGIADWFDDDDISDHWPVWVTFVTDIE